MTREEAIEFGNMWLEVNEVCKDSDVDDRNTYEFFQIATKALEQEPCEDYISRQALLKLIGEEPFNWTDSDKELQAVEDYRNFRNIVEQLPSVNPQKPKIGHWIPVSERLPNHDEYIKNNGLFNVYDGNRSYSEWFDIYEKKRFGEPTISGFRVDYAVIAWMPLPEPYKAESEE